MAVTAELDRLRAGADRAAVLAAFDALEPAGPDAVRGLWRGAEVPTGHPFDGLLRAHGWWGKAVLDADAVHPLLVGRRPRPVQPALVPFGLLARAPGPARSRPARVAGVLARPLLRTSRPAARVRVVVHRGVATAALVYDRLPVLDVLRADGPDRLLGLMDARGVPEPFPFLLERDRG
ncbi:DUF4334 domain-containing protein [Geodermatophilus marinus]|nr:DUF4334 domain-containing protein [Geodermatophilus sp. LHW52908]